MDDHREIYTRTTGKASTRDRHVEVVTTPRGRIVIQYEGAPNRGDYSQALNLVPDHAIRLAAELLRAVDSERRRGRD